MSVKITAVLAPFERGRLLTYSALLLVFGFSLFFRCVSLGNIPGVNGDEVVVAVTLHEASEGEPVILRMPTGRMFSPLYGGIAYFVDRVFPRSFAMIRLPALTAGLLLVFLTFFLYRKILGPTIALWATLFIATSSVNIAYSRSGIEQSFTGLFGILLFYSALKGRLGWASLLAVLALVMHPTNAFSFFVVLTLAASWVSNHPEISREKKKQLFLLGALACLGLGGVLFSLVPPKFSDILEPKAILGRALDFRSLGFFYFNWLNLITGTVAIEQFVAPVPAVYRNALLVFFGTALPVVAFLGVRKLIQEKKHKEMAFVLGTFLMTASFYLLTGNWAMEPGVLRYSLVLLNPALISLALLLGTFQKERKAIGAGVTVLSFLFLVQFSVFFFREIKTSNSTAHFTYQTGDIEPKVVAFERAKAITRHPRLLLVEDWWTFWPIRYLALSEPLLDVRLLDGKNPLPQLKATLEEGGIVLGPTGGLFEKTLSNAPFNGISLQTSQIEGFGRKPVLRLWLLTEKSS